MLEKKKIRQVALICNVSRPYDRRIIAGIAQYVREVGNWSLYTEEDPVQKLPDLHSWHGDGIIADFDDKKMAAALTGVKIPIVGIGGGRGWYDPASKIPYFLTDNVGIAKLAAEHLLNCGLKRFAYCGYSSTRVNVWSAERGRTFKQTVKEAGCPCSTYTRRATTRQWADLQHKLASWLASLKHPVGLMACNDARARHVLEACQSIGLRVPDDVAVVGVDNDEIMCELSRPQLTSVEQGTMRMGYEAAVLLDKLMAGRKVKKLKYLIESDGLIPRQSTDILTVEDPAVAIALRYIRDHACDKIQLCDILDQVDVSCSTLSKRFQTILGRTIHAEVHRIRVERSKYLLSATKLPIKEVSQLSGFTYVQHMTTMFRLATGQTPAEYRKRMEN